MPELVPDLAPLVVGALLAWAGAVKLFGRSTPQQAADSALGRLLRDVRWTTRALRALGAVELVVATALLLTPTWSVAAGAATALGIGFIGYLGYAKVTAPESSCGCTGSRHTPITWRAFARAGLVVTGGLMAASATSPWWASAAAEPVASAAVVAAWTVGLAALSTDLDRLWLLPLRRARLRLLGHPLEGTDGEVPVAATVELLEHSLAWQAASPVVRSALLEHWDAEGWRILRYSGVDNGPDGPRPVSVLFALDPRATIDTTENPVVRVSVIDEDLGEVAEPSFGTTSRPLLPMTSATG